MRKTPLKVVETNTGDFVSTHRDISEGDTHDQASPNLETQTVVKQLSSPLAFHEEKRSRC